MKVIFVLGLFIAVALCATGVDISDAVSLTDFQCLYQKSFTYAIVRYFRSTGQVDPNCAASVRNAHSAGLSNVDLYVFPCFSCGRGGNQINATMLYAQQNGVKYSTMWLDIEQSNLWGSVSANQAFFQDMLAAAKFHGLNIGVYTSASQWVPIMGSSYSGGSAYPLWYAHYDNNPSFSDFSGFGGWSRPTMKQYNGDQTLCNVGVDLNWYPGGSATATTSTNSTSGPASHSSVSGPSSGPTSTGHTSSSGPSSSGPSSSGPASGPSSSGPSSSTSSGYSSSGSSGTGELQVSEDSIYSTKERILALEKIDQSVKGTKEVRIADVDEIVEDDHFQMWEERESKKFT